MRSSAVTILLVQAACAATSAEQGGAFGDTLVDRLYGRVHDVLPISSDLDNATLGKSGQLATSSRTSLKALPSLRSSLGGDLSSRFGYRLQAMPGGRHLDGRAWAEALALTPCARMLKSQEKGRGPHTPKAQSRPVTADRESLAQKSPVQTQIEEIIGLQPVVVFSKTTCPFCAKAKQALNDAGVPRAATIELDTLDPKVANEIQDHLMTLTGARTVPRVFVGHKFIGGGTETASMGESGQLKTLVDEAMTKNQEDLQGKDIGTLQKTQEEWKSELSPDIFRILRKRGTEMPHSHEYNQFYPTVGYFSCAGCDLPLYSAQSKFRSNCGWPVFDKCYHSEEIGCHVCTRPDGTGSLEIMCPRCAGHLGHVFFDSFSAENPNGERH
jgi:peptide-methionine (R)-S-oxide reductase